MGFDLTIRTGGKGETLQRFNDTNFASIIMKEKYYFSSMIQIGYSASSLMPYMEFGFRRREIGIDLKANNTKVFALKKVFNNFAGGIGIKFDGNPFLVTLGLTVIQDTIKDFYIQKWGTSRDGWMRKNQGFKFVIFPQRRLSILI